MAITEPRPPPLKNPRFRYLVGALTVSGSGDWLYNAALIALVLARTGSAAWLAAASAARLIPQILLGPVGGAIADRFDRKRVLLIADVTRAALMGALAATAAADGPLLVILLLAAATTAAGTPYYPAVAALTPPVVGESHLAAANAIAKACEHLSIALGPAIGGILLAAGSPALAFAVNATSFLGSAILIRSVRVDPGATLEQREIGLKEGLVEGFRALTSGKDLLVLVGLFGTVTFTLGQGFVLLPLVADELLGTGPEGVGFLLTALGLGGIIAAAPAAKLASLDRSGLAIGLTVLVAGMPLLLVPYVSSAPIAYGLMAIEGASTVVLSVLAITMLQRLLPGELLGRVFSMLHSLAVASIVAGTLLTPVAVGLLGLRGSLTLAGGLLVAIALATYPKVRGLDARAADRSHALEDRVGVLDALGIFDGAAHSGLESLAERLRRVDVAAGTEVISQGAEADDFYIVVSGELDVLAEGSKINVMGPGDYFGEIGLIENRPRTATVVARTACVLYRLDGDAFLEAVTHSPTETLTEAMLGRLALTGTPPPR